MPSAGLVSGKGFTAVVAVVADVDAIAAAVFATSKFFTFL